MSAPSTSFLMFTKYRKKINNFLDLRIRIHNTSRQYRKYSFKDKMSSHLVWSIIRNNNAFLLKKRNISKPFSTEANNLTNLSSYRYNGLVHKKSVGIVDAPDKKGFTVVYKKASKHNKPRKNTIKRTMKAGPRRSLYKLKRLLNKNRYRTDLTKVALRRASAILRSQKAIPQRKPKTTKKTE